MAYGIAGTLILIMVVGPYLWVKYVIWRHSTQIEDMPGTGAELANHLIARFQLDGVKVEEGMVEENSYSPSENKVRLEPNIYNGKSLSAIAVAAHEVGHAIQFTRREPVSLLRGKYLSKANVIQKTGIILLFCMPLVAGILRIPHLAIWMAILGIVTMLASVLMYVAILPEEYDASFKKALPILEEGYVPPKHIPAIRNILTACAYTYVAGALADILRLWRWITILK